MNVAVLTDLTEFRDARMGVDNAMTDDVNKKSQKPLDINCTG